MQGGHGKQSHPYLQAFPQMPVAGPQLGGGAPMYAGLMPYTAGPGILFPYPTFPGPMPADGLARAYGGFAPMALPQDMSADTAALTERLNELHLGGMGGASRSRGMPPPSGPYGAPPLRGQGASHTGYPAYTGNQQNHNNGGGGGGGRGLRSQGGRGRGQGPAGGRGQQAPKKTKRSQKGMEENVKRTVYISYVDHQVTEEQLAMLFSECGKVLDCRICGDPNSAMRFAFIEFSESASAQKALEKSGTVLGSSPLRVLPSKTAIMPVNRELMPRSSEEIERCSRTVYAANIDKKVDRNDVKAFFESLCGKVSKIRLLGDYAHATRIAFVEFVEAEGALAALNCSGALLGSLPIRVSPSKTPVKMDSKDDTTSSSSSLTASAAAAAVPAVAVPAAAAAAPAAAAPAPPQPQAAAAAPQPAAA